MSVRSVRVSDATSRLIAMRWPITSTASTAPLWVLAHRAIWLRLFPMRDTCRVRSRSTSAAGTVQVRVRAIARRIRAESGTPAAFALLRQSADSSGVRRTATRIGRRLAIGQRRHGGNGGDAPARAIQRSAGQLGIEGAESLASPRVIPGVCWLPGLSRARQARGRRVRNPATVAADAVAKHLRERFGEPVQTDLAKRGWRWVEGQRRRAVRALRKPKWRMIPPSPMSMDAGTASALGSINLTTRDSSVAWPRLLVLPFTLRWPEGQHLTDLACNRFQSSLEARRPMPVGARLSPSNAGADSDRFNGSALLFHRFPESTVWGSPRAEHGLGVRSRDRRGRTRATPGAQRDAQ